MIEPSRPAGTTDADRTGAPSAIVDLNADLVLPREAVGTATPVVTFSRLGRAIPWDDRYETLIELADDHAIEISVGCRYGDCGTCLTRLIEGTVSYNHRTGITPDAGFCLPCSCRPSTSIVLEL